MKININYAGVFHNRKCTHAICGLINDNDTRIYDSRGTLLNIDWREAITNLTTGISLKALESDGANENDYFYIIDHLIYISE